MADKKNRDHLQVTGKFYHTSPYVPVLFCCNFFGYIHMVNSTGIHDVTSYLAKNSIDEKICLEWAIYHIWGKPANPYTSNSEII